MEHCPMMLCTLQPAAGLTEGWVRMRATQKHNKLTAHNAANMQHCQGHSSRAKVTGETEFTAW